jgi:hypothetical protein
MKNLKPIGHIFLAIIGISLFQNCNTNAEPKNDGTIENVAEQDSISQVEGRYYLLQGKQLALSTKAVLEQNLMAAMKENGPIGALEFCNVNAIPLSDSVSLALNAEIRRVSAKNRNPENAPNERERAYLERALKEVSLNGQAPPQMQEIDGKMVGYYPIMINGACLKCHGTPHTDIQSSTFETIQKLYPEDKATGYKVDELRGMWVITMDKK